MEPIDSKEDPWGESTWIPPTEDSNLSKSSKTALIILGVLLSLIGLFLFLAFILGLFGQESNSLETIDDLLPKDLDYIFLLYEEKPNYGHWVLLSKYNDTIEMFNSYGDNYIDEPLYWLPLERRKKLGTGIPYLTNLLKNTNYCDYAIIFNEYDFQDETDNKISTCGRWCSLRLKTILNKRMPLITFINMMKDIKNKTKLRYDVIVSDLINKV
jgi:hypothetical protein